MISKKGTLGIANVFSNLFRNFPRLLLTNVLFAVPFAIFFAVFYAINSIIGINSNFIIFLTAIPLFPFYAGVVQVTAHMAKGEENVNVFGNFFAAVKDNFLRFLIHGVVFYCAIFFSYYSIVMYTSIGTQNGAFFVLLAVSIIVSVFFLFAFFYIPAMTVTFDISMKDIYKNSILMSFGEFKNNLIATFGLFLVFVISTSVIWICGQVAESAVIIGTIILILFFIPSISSFIINSAVYKRMYIMIVDRETQSKEIDKKMENRRNGQFIDNVEQSNSDFDDSLKRLNIEDLENGDEYIYFNGKMVKKSVILKMKKEADEKETR